MAERKNPTVTFQAPPELITRMDEAAEKAGVSRSRWLLETVTIRLDSPMLLATKERKPIAEPHDPGQRKYPREQAGCPHTIKDNDFRCRACGFKKR